VVRARFVYKHPHLLPTGKSRVKPKEKHMVMDRQSPNPLTFPYADGRIGNVRDCASSSERRRGEETSKECTLPDTRPGKGTSSPETK